MKEKRKSVRGEGEKKGKNVTYDREVSRDWRAKLNEFWFWFFDQFCVSLMYFFFDKRGWGGFDRAYMRHSTIGSMIGKRSRMTCFFFSSNREFI